MTEMNLLSGIAGSVPVNTSKVSDGMLANMPAPASVSTVLWSLLGLGERREMLLAAAEPAAGASACAVGAKHQLGALSMIYETSTRPENAVKAAAKVSSGMLRPGKPDPGGVSYGTYQLASSAAGGRNVQTFLMKEGARWAGEFKGMNPEVKGAFGATWARIAAREPQAFFDAQHSYIKRDKFDPVVASVKKNTGLDIGTRSAAVQDVTWSMAVQHGGAKKLIAGVVDSLKGRIEPTAPGYDKALINALYDAREAYVGKLGTGADLQKRYTAERQDALRMNDAR